MHFLLPLLLLLAACPQWSSLAEDTHEDTQIDRPCVVLLHGLRRSSGSMRHLEEVLTDAGYRTVPIDYDSARQTIEALAMVAVPEAVDLCRSHGCTSIHFVTHSMGGIILRYYLSKHTINRLGRVVMLSPPNQGSEVVDALRDSFLFKWYNGPAGQQLGTGPNGIAARLGPVDFPLGIITGNKPSLFDAWLTKYFPGENDGKVSVQRAKVDGMRDFLVLPYSHTFIMNRAEVIRQVRYFLRQGSFKRQK